MILLELYFEFFKIGLFAVGGGLATLPFLYELADTKGWIQIGDIADMVAVSESTPGPLGINMATYVGYTTGGLLGGIIAVLGIITPSVIIIMIIASFIRKFRESKTVENIFYGLRPTATALIAVAGFEVFKMIAFRATELHTISRLLENLRYGTILILALLSVLIFRTKWHPVFYILISAVIGIIFQLN